MIVTVVDTETSCLEGEEGEGCVIELAAVELDGTENWECFSSVQQKFGLPNGTVITPRASAIHHITSDAVADYFPLERADWDKIVMSPQYIVAHNAAFDRQMIERAVGPIDVPWICTLKCARLAWPEEPSFSNQALRYLRGLKGYLPSDLHPHRALYDAIVTSWIFKDLINHFESLEKMVEISSQPSLLSRINFGKHKGMKWYDAPRDYLAWVLRQDFDEDVRYTAKHWLYGNKHE